MPGIPPPNGSSGPMLSNSIVVPFAKPLKSTMTSARSARAMRNLGCAVPALVEIQGVHIYRGGQEPLLGADLVHLDVPDY